MIRSTTLGLGVLAAALLAACGTEPPLKDKAPVENRKPTAAGSGGAATAPATAAAPTPQTRVATVDLAAQNAAAAARATAPAQRVVYFDFDSFLIKDEFKPVIEGHAKALASIRTKKMAVEGHTDERGGSEYNLALGQKRAEAVAKSLELLGVGDSQVEAVSFGKERPADTGHDETAWAKNRRAELKDR